MEREDLRCSDDAVTILIAVIGNQDVAFYAGKASWCLDGGLDSSVHDGREAHDRPHGRGVFGL